VPLAQPWRRTEKDFDVGEHLLQLALDDPHGALTVLPVVAQEEMERPRSWSARRRSRRIGELQTILTGLQRIQKHLLVVVAVAQPTCTSGAHLCAATLLLLREQDDEDRAGEHARHDDRQQHHQGELRRRQRELRERDVHRASG
jgi:hypothetical protein